MEVGLGPDDIVLDGDSAPLQKAAQPPLFGPCLLWPNGRCKLPQLGPGRSPGRPTVFSERAVARLSVCLSSVCL